MEGARESFVSLSSTIVDQNRRPKGRVISNEATPLLGVRSYEVLLDLNC